MVTKGQEKRIKALYVEYQEDIKPLTFYVERKYHKFPKSLLKEFRDVFDHISRCYEEEAAEEYKEENIKKAENHFDRIKLDTFKYVSDYKKREFLRWKKKYSKYDLQSIDNGEFWKKVLNLEDVGERIFSVARSIESKDIINACNLIQESTLKYDAISTLLQEKRRLIVEAKFKYRKVTILNWLIGFGVGIASSIIATCIYEYIFLHR